MKTFASREKFLVRSSVYAFLFLSACAMQAATVITPVGVGAVAGGVNFGGMFDAQPGSIPTIGVTTDAMGSGYDYFAATGDGTRTGYIDFGASFATITLQQVIVGLKQFGGASTAGITYAWSSDTAIGGDTTESNDLGLFSTASADSNKQWISTWTGSITIPQRYLLATYASGSTSNRPTELVFVGTVGVVPEPSTYALIGAGLTTLVFFRRRFLA
jgi:hypothetical protein